MRQITTPRTPSGFNEYLPAYQIEFNRLLDVICRTYEKYGFAPLDTPVLELSEVLLAKGGGDTEKQVYRFERGRNDLTMRYDLTVPLARYVAEHQNDLIFPFRRYQIGKVYRAERAQAGRFREFYQCDVDIIGEKNLADDAEMIAIINDIFQQFCFGEFVVHINNRRLLNGFFEGIGLNKVSSSILRAIDKAEKITTEELKRELMESGCDANQADRILQFIELKGTNSEILQQLKSTNIDNKEFLAGIEELDELINILDMMSIPNNRYQIDLKIARGLDYYTGTVYETNLVEYPEIGSVCSGGRYDNLAGNYTKKELAGVGVSIGLSRLFYKLCEAGIINSDMQTTAEIAVLPFSKEQLSYAIKVAEKLRENNKVIIYSNSGNLSKKLKYIDRLGIEKVAIIGGDEDDSQTVMMKNMQTGESEQIPFVNL